MYACLADYPIEAGEVFFFCLGFDQQEDEGDRMTEMAKRKQADHQHLLNR